MLTIFVFDEKESRREEDLPDGLKSLDDKAMLWVALRDPTEEEVAAVQEAFQLSDQAGAEIARAAEPTVAGRCRRAHACDAVRG